MTPNNKKHTEKSLKQGAGFSDNFISSSYNISKSGKAMMVDEMLIGVQESRDKYVKDLQQENARLKEISWDWERKYFDLIKSTDKELKVLRQTLEEIKQNITDELSGRIGFPISSRIINRLREIIDKALKGEKR